MLVAICDKCEKRVMKPLKVGGFSIFVAKLNDTIADLCFDCLKEIICESTASDNTVSNPSITGRVDLLS